MSCSSFNGNQCFISHIRKFIGETVTIFTTSGGVSGCGFTGVVLAVNCDFVRLVTNKGTAPTCPLGAEGSSCCNCSNNGYTQQDYEQNCEQNHHPDCSHRPVHNVGSVCDIPIDKIAAFCHNAV